MSRPARLVLLGHPVAHSLSPAIHRAALAAAGIQVSYTALDIQTEQLAGTLASLEREGAAGNITVPHKAAAAAIIRSKSAVATRTGAVNTLTIDQTGRLGGDNTDVFGFVQLATRALDGPPSKLDFAVIGAGGAAAAVLSAIESWDGCTATVFARRIDQASELSARFSGFARAQSVLGEAVSAANVVVNATPVGLYDDDLPFALERLRTGAVVLDLVYRRGGTPLVQQAVARGHRARDGLTMLVEQAAASFFIWFGVQPDKGVMWNAVREAGFDA